jgi:hypothetical protein
MSEPLESTPLGILLGRGFFSQVLLVLVLLTAVFIIMMTFEYILMSYMSIGSRVKDLLPYTVTAEDKQLTFRQDPFRYKEADILPLSDNERTGVEFTYSMYLFIHPSTFTGEDTLHHILHKGYTTPWPLMGPGLFVRGNSNTLRVIMNTYRNPYTYSDVENIPIRKWFHLALVCRKNNMEIYINGNLRKKLPFEKTLPYQNFQDLILFSPLKFTVRASQTAAVANAECPTGADDAGVPLNVPGLGDQTMRFSGSVRGNMSNLIYFAYAATYTEINSLMNKGVSSRTLTSTQDVPPYLIDTYWTTSYQQQA